MNENLKTIMKAASEDDELMAKASALMNELNAAEEADRPEVVARIISFAEDKGFALTEEDLVFEAPAEGKVEDEELMVVAGGCEKRQPVRSAWPDPRKHGGWC